MTCSFRAVWRCATISLITGVAVVGTATAQAARSTADTTATLVINVRGLPDSAGSDVRVTGPAAYSQQITTGRTLSGLAAGSYTVAAKGVSIGGISYIPSESTQTVTLAADSTVTITITYGPPLLSGGLTVTITGLPNGAAASIRHADSSQRLPPCALQRALETFRLARRGPYAITAAYVTKHRRHLRPGPRDAGHLPDARRGR